MSAVVRVSRRDFAKISSVATAGLVLGVAYASDPKKPAASVEKKTHDFGSFVQLDADGAVTVWVSKTEMGQGVRTSLPMIVAEELDADWSRVKIRQAHFSPKFGRMGTGGSGSIRTMWMPLRQAGAAARAMLVSAAATKLGVDASTLTTSKGVITHAESGRKVGYGEVAEAAAKLELPADVKLKDPKNFLLIGKVLPKMDDRDIVTGKSGYGIDADVPGLLHAVVLRSPVFGGKVASFDATKAKAVPGVKHVVQVNAMGTDLPWNGVAVVATNTWAAIQGRDALEVKWDEGEWATESTDALWKQFATIIDQAAPVHSVGDVDAAMTSAAKKIEATYELPYIAHAALEPLNATAHVKPDGTLEIWAPTQFADWAARSAAPIVGFAPEQAAAKIRVNVTMLGGSFGRKINPDFILEAVQIAKATGAPVKVQWTREDDMQHDYYRPASYHRVSGGIDADGKLVAWHHRFAAPSIRAYMNPAATDPHDSETGGIDDTPYVVPNFRVDFALAKSGVPRGWWRSVEHSITGFVVNAFLDEAATAAGKDPIEFQLAMLPAGRKAGPSEGPSAAFPMESDRLRKVIELVREKSGWGSKLPDGVGRGFAAHWSFLSYAAQVAEVSIVDGAPKIHRVVCAIDCGTVVNPDGVRAQVEGAIVYGLAAALGQQITIANGRVEQSNFHDYPLMTIAQMPEVEVHIVPSGAAPTGTGEPGLPPAAAAVANAIFNATGKRVRKLPFTIV